MLIINVGIICTTNLEDLQNVEDRKKSRNYMVTNLKVTISSVYLPFVVNGKSTVGSYSLVDFSVLGLAKDTGGD